MILFGRAGLTSLGLAHRGIGDEAGRDFRPILLASHAGSHWRLFPPTGREFQLAGCGRTC